MKNQDNIKLNVSLLQYPKQVFFRFGENIFKIKILPYQKALYFCTAKQTNDFKPAYTSSSFYPWGKL